MKNFLLSLILMVFSVGAFAEPLVSSMPSTMNQTGVREHLEDGDYTSDKNFFCLFNFEHSATLTNLEYNVYSSLDVVYVRAKLIVWADFFPNWIKNINQNSDNCSIAIFFESKNPIASRCQIIDYEKKEGLIGDSYMIQFLFAIGKSSFEDLLTYDITSIALAPQGASNMLDGNFTLIPNPDESNNSSKFWFLSATKSK